MPGASGHIFTPVSLHFLNYLEEREDEVGTRGRGTMNPMLQRQLVERLVLM